MEKAGLIVRILLGLMMVVFGLNKFIGFMPMPPMQPEMGAFMGALMATGYLMTLIAIIEIVGGLMLLANKYSALALVLLFPILLNAFLAHLFLDIGGIIAAALALIMTIYLFFKNKDKYMPFLQA